MHTLHGHQALTKILPVPVTETDKYILACHISTVQPFTDTGTVIAIATP